MWIRDYNCFVIASLAREKIGAIKWNNIKQMPRNETEAIATAIHISNSSVSMVKGRRGNQTSSYFVNFVYVYISKLDKPENQRTNSQYLQVLQSTRS